MADETKSLGKQIRASTESEDYDLAGYNATQCQDMVTAAFSDPIALPPGKMIRITFVIGGGKKVRQKYGENLARDLGTALNSVGFEDDKGASCMLACQGTYKYQHDTDKDLKFMHVFPRVKELEVSATEVEEDNSGPDWAYLRSCDVREFEDSVTEMTPTFSQKRALLRVLKGISAKFADMDKKLINMETLDATEQELYDSGIEIGEKVKWLEKVLDEMLETGQLTAGEQLKMTRELDEKLVQLDEQIASLQAKGKKTEKLEAGKETVKGKREAIASAKPIVIQADKSAKDVEELRQKLFALNKLDAKPGLRSADEVQKLLAKPQLEERLKALESKSKGMGWFEKEFLAAEALIPKPQKKAASKSRPVSSSGGGGSRGGGGGGTISLGGWTSNSAVRRPPSGGGRSKPAMSNPFAMLDDE